MRTSSWAKCQNAHIAPHGWHVENVLEISFEQIDGAAEGWRKLLGKPCHTCRMGGNRPRSVAATAGGRRGWARGGGCCIRDRRADDARIASDIRAREPGTSASGHFTGMPTRSLHAHGAVAPGDASGAQFGWHNALRAALCPAARSGARRPVCVAATAGTTRRAAWRIAITSDARSPRLGFPHVADGGMPVQLERVKMNVCVRSAQAGESAHRNLAERQGHAHDR